MERVVFFPDEPDPEERRWRRPLPEFQQTYVDREYARIRKTWRKMRAENLKMMRKFNRLRSKKLGTPAKTP